jgi:hypothetical protein
LPSFGQLNIREEFMATPNLITDLLGARRSNRTVPVTVLTLSPSITISPTTIPSGVAR